MKQFQMCKSHAGLKSGDVVKTKNHKFVLLKFWDKVWKDWGVLTESGAEFMMPHSDILLPYEKASYDVKQAIKKYEEAQK